jgi:hypothetical protein
VKAALGCLEVGGAAGLLTFTGLTRAAAAEILFILGFVSGLALLWKEIRGGVHSQGDPTGGETRRVSGGDR